MDEEQKNLKFPEGFLWGAATSAHQVEGNNHNDWTEWEKANAQRLAKEAGGKWQKWQQKKFPEIFDPANYISGRACDHYNLYEKDFDIAKSLGHNAHRFSIEWSRIEPEEGKFNEEAIEHYRQVILALRARGLEPFVTLWHWTNPIWIRDIGGWHNPKTIEYFLRYTKLMFREYRDLVRFWMPLNEPGTQISLGHILGKQPPGEKKLLKANKIFKHLIIAHKEAFTLSRQLQYPFEIGASHFMFYFMAYNNYLWNYIPKTIISYLADRRFFKVFNNYSDFFGIQYYQPFIVKLKIGGRVLGIIENKQPGEKRSDLGWEIFPKGIYHNLLKVAKYNKPIYITENGLADSDDSRRESFIKDHLFWINKAINKGADIRGYFHWSLLDNFELPEVRGFWPKFGLVEIDYETMERKIRPSAMEYAKICKNNSLIFHD